MKRLFMAAALLAAVLCADHAMAWSGWGHQLIAHIAERHLTPRARANIESYLGTSIVEEAAWLDRVASWNRSDSHIDGWEQTSWWHMCTVDKQGKGYVPSNRRAYNGDGDLLPNLKRCIAELSDRSRLSDSAVVVNIRCVVHMIGDMHCPSHIYYTEFPDVFSQPKPKDPSAVRVTRYDQFRLTYNGKPSRYHGLWDGTSIRAVHPELGTDLDEFGWKLDKYSRKRREKVCSGSPEEWVAGNAAACRQIYDWAYPGDSIGTSFFVEHRDLSESQLLKASYRLAHVLNELFDE